MKRTRHDMEDAPFSVGVKVYHIKDFSISEFIVFSESNNFFMDILGNRHSKKKCFLDRKYAVFKVYENIERMLNENGLSVEKLNAIKEEYSKYKGEKDG